jgi:hypothetical protein
MQNRRNYYRVLHVQPDAPFEIVRASHRTLMQVLKMHPDLGGKHWDAALVNEAFATLIDPAQRAAYDRTLAQRARPPRNHIKQAPPADPMHACVFCAAPFSPRDANRPSAMCGICDSPLYRTTKQQHHIASRRALARIARDAPVVFCLSWPEPRFFAGRSEDISVIGMRFISELELVPGDRLRLDCDFCSSVGVVRHARRHAPAEPGHWHIGVEFLTLRVRRGRGILVSVDV